MGILKKAISTGVVLMSTFALATGVFADEVKQTKTTDFGVKIKSGGHALQVPTIKPLSDITLTENTKQYATSFNGNITVKDLSGSHKGWKLNVHANPLVSGVEKLPTGTLVLDPLSKVTKIDDGAKNNPPKASMSEAKIIDNGAVEVAKSLKDEGMGVYDLTFATNSLKVNVDSNTAKALDYATEVVWTLVQAP